MSLYYRGIQSPMPNKDGKKQWHPILVTTGTEINSVKIARKIARLTTAHEGDVHNIVRALTEVMREELLNGHSVRLDGFGSFTLHIRSRGNGVDEEEMINASQINALICKFRPEYHRSVNGVITRELFEGVEFININQRLARDSGKTNYTEKKEKEKIKRE